MAFAWFSNKQSPKPESSRSSSEADPLVRTMQDDIESIKSGNVSPKPFQFKQVPSSRTTANPFGAEGEQLSPAEQVGNPFGIVPEQFQSRPAEQLEQPKLDNGLNVLVPAGELLVNQPQNNHRKLRLIIIIMAILLLLGGGAFYFFWNNQSQEPENLPVPAAVTETPVDVPPDIIPESPFALDKPNYLSINTETVSPAEIRQILSQTAERVKGAQITTPIAFLITDQNNNPLAFSRLAFLLKLDVASEALDLIDETFTVYIYNDASNMRLGLALTLKDAQAAALALAKTEPSLPYAFRALILEPDVSVAKNITFRSNAYNQYSIRFANIDSERGLSLDYALKDNQWYIGMSKYTLRAILDMNAK